MSPRCRKKKCRDNTTQHQPKQTLFHHKLPKNNIPCLKQFNDFLKNSIFEFGCCHVCNQKKYKHEFQICKITNLNTSLKTMKTLFKFNWRHHWQNKVEIIPKEWLNNTKHMHPQLQGLLLTKEGISSTKISICNSCHNCLLNNKMLKLALANKLWIGITINSLPKLMIVEEALIACYGCWTILIKLRFSNKGGKIDQHGLKGNVISFSQDPKSVVKLLDILPLIVIGIIVWHCCNSFHW